MKLNKRFWVITIELLLNKSIRTTYKYRKLTKTGGFKCDLFVVQKYSKLQAEVLRFISSQKRKIGWDPSPSVGWLRLREIEAVARSDRSHRFYPTHCLTPIAKVKKSLKMSQIKTPVGITTADLALEKNRSWDCSAEEQFPLQIIIKVFFLFVFMKLFKVFLWFFSIFG